MNKIFTNEKRTRYYGLRVGDIIQHSAFGIEFQGEIIELGGSDNNCVYVKREDNGESVKAVAEWCKIITKVEDRKEEISPINK